MSFGLSSALADTWTSVSTAVRIGNWRPANRLLQVSPLPLIHPEGRMIVIFSPKAACSSVVIWFLHQIGHAERAQQYHGWPHKYRIEVYYKTDLYRRALSLDLRDFRVVRVVRDPFDRAVSSFRHVQRSGIADAAFAQLLGRTDVAEAGVSFCEFLNLLERMDLTACDEHYGVQRHPLEDKLPVTHLINVSTEDLFTRLNQVEADLGLPRTNFDQLRWIHDLDRRRSQSRFMIRIADAYALPLTRVQARKGPWPLYNALLTPAARERIARLYAADIAAYSSQSSTPAYPDPVRAHRRALRAERMKRRGHAARRARPEGQSRTPHVPPLGP